MSEKRFYIAGVQHHELHKVITQLEEGDELELIPEPKNKFDPNAVRIEFEGVMCGYVPKKFSAEIAGMLEIGADLLCTITKLDPTAKPWEWCEVSIQALEDEAGKDPDYEPELEDEL